MLFFGPQPEFSRILLKNRAVYPYTALTVLTVIICSNFPNTVFYLIMIFSLLVPCWLTTVST